MNRSGRRITETMAMLMIGDGILGLVHPKQHCRLWRGGTGWWRRTVDWFAEHSDVTRAVGAIELGAGVWLALRQEDQYPAGANS